jgi:histidinol-phosphatase (PHP family)
MKVVKNYHTHTYRCQHASGDVDDYCVAAVQYGLEVLGMSDHTALPDNRWPRVRMAFTELEDYLAAVDRAIIEHPDLTILKGVESEFSEDYVAYFEDGLFGKYAIDYMVGGTHYFPCGDRGWQGAYGGTGTLQGLRAYTDHFIKSMRSGLFAFMAHPDLFGNSYLEWDANTDRASHDICAAAAELGVPLEINGYGLRKRTVSTKTGDRPMYPWLPFWEIAAGYDVRVVVNSDAHRPQDVAAGLDETLAIANRFDLKLADLSYLET